MSDTHIMWLISELLYCGRCLQDDKPLESYGVKPGVTVHVLSKINTEPDPDPEPMASSAVNQVVTALQAALINPAYRNTVRTLF